VSVGPAILKIDIITDASKATAGLDKIGSAASKNSTGVDKASSSLKTLGKTAALAAGAAAVGGLVAVFKTGADEQKDFLAGQAQLANGIKSTGNAAGVTVDGLEDLAGSIQGYSGQTDDSIVASENLLLTFTNLKNGVGDGNQVFDEATKMTADMAAKMGGDASKYAVQLGKALNDPYKGIAALSRVGVTFTQQQKDQIKALQDSGDTMGAQKVILAELQKEFGGAAQAAGQSLPGQLAIAKRGFEDVSQGLVAGLMPVLTTLVNILNQYVMPAFKATMGFISEHQTIFGILAAAIGIVVAAIKVWSIVQAILNSTLLANPIVAIIAGILALIAALVIAYKKVGWFRDLVNAAFGVIKTVIGAVMAFITQVVPNAFAAVVGFVTGLPRRLAAAGAGIWDWITARWSAVWGAVTGAIGAAVSFVGTIPRKFAAAASAVWGWISERFAAAWSAVTSAVAGAVSWVAGIPARFKSAAGDVWAWLGSTFQSAWSAVESAFGTALNWIRGIPSAIASALSGLFGIITQPFRDAWDWINSHLIGPVKNTWNGIANAINGVQFSVTVPSWVPGIGGKGWTLGLPDLPLLDSGGYITSATLAVVGERRPEIVAPEDVIRRIIREEGGGGGPTIIVQGALDPNAVARQIDDLLTNHHRRVAGVRNIRGSVR
jgi:hypothetical protein